MYIMAIAILCCCQTRTLKESQVALEEIQSVQKALRQKKTNHAIQQLEVILQKHPYDFFLLNNLGALYCQHHKTRQGQELLKRALKIMPNQRYFLELNLKQCQTPNKTLT